MNTLPPTQRPRYPTLDEVASRPGTAIDDDPIAVLDQQPAPTDLYVVAGTGPMLFDGTPSPMTPPFPTTPHGFVHCPVCSKFEFAMRIPPQMEPGFETAMATFLQGPGLWRVWGDPTGQTHIVFSMPLVDLQNRIQGFRDEVAELMAPAMPPAPPTH